MPANKKNTANKKKDAKPGGKQKQKKETEEKKEENQPEVKLENSDLIKTGKEAFEKIADLALEGKIKGALRVRCLIFLAEQWTHNARRRDPEVPQPPGGRIDKFGGAEQERGDFLNQEVEADRNEAANGPDGDAPEEEDPLGFKPESLE
jgi:hypothetical protein